MSARNLTVHCSDEEPVQEVQYQKPVSTKGGVARGTRRNSSNHTQWRWMVDPCSKVGPSNNFVENGKLSIKNQKSSAGYPESNRRAELAVKTLKRMIEKDMSNDGSLHSEAMVHAKFQFKKTPIRGCSNLIWSAFDGQFTNGPERRLEDSRELGMAKLKVDRKETYDKGKQNLEPLKNEDGYHDRKHLNIVTTCPSWYTHFIYLGTKNNWSSYKRM